MALEQVFINEDGLAVTNWHVLKPGQENSSLAVLYQDDPNDSQIYSNNKRNFKNIKWSSDVNGLDITIVSVDLENGEKVPFFNIASQRPNQGDAVATYGNPHGLTASFTKGSVSAFRKDPYNPNRNVDLMQYDMTTTEVILVAQFAISMVKSLLFMNLETSLCKIPIMELMQCS